MQPKNMLVSNGMFAGIHKGMSIAAKAMILAFVLFTVLNVDFANGIYSDVKSWIQTTLNWYYVTVVSVVLFFSIWVAFSRYGNIKLGADDEKPEFGFFTWFSMLFSCAIGVGILFWSIAEPIYHFQGNPFIEMAGIAAGTPEAAQVALRITLFHWGLHGWAIYIIVGLMIAYFACRRGLPMTIRSALYPILGDKIYGPAGHAVDLLAIFSTLFGTATALGLGVSQMNAGLNYLFGIEVSKTTQILLIAGITVIATLSTMSGLQRGIRLLSVWNIRLSLILIGFFVIAGPTVYLLGLVPTSIGDYLWNMIPMGFWTDPDPKGQWQGWWTIFYWGWWLSWGPLVGLFIARISRGRTIREFLLSALIIPPLGGFLWIIAFGGTALNIELYGAGGIVDAVNNNMTMALYHTIEAIGVEALTWPMALLATLMIVTWFVTSADSGTLVICTILSMGAKEPPLSLRAVWGVLLGAVAAVLLLAGGLKALQSATIAAALPFSAVLLLMCVALVKGFRDERDGVFYGKDDLANPEALKTAEEAAAVEAKA